ncbi:MAG TPA: hypothetical protein VLU43_02360 [Anaeromyxobacteraceae bacterium]|nr:hypothetical protein [Anaeromyxobacteraceae bacterium]
MGKPRLPELESTDRHYVDNTIRARLASPGILRYRPDRPRGARSLVLALLFGAALIGALLWLAGRM